MDWAAPPTHYVVLTVFPTLPVALSLLGIAGTPGAAHLDQVAAVVPARARPAVLFCGSWPPAASPTTLAPIAGIVVFLVWLWISDLALLAGAQFNAELAALRHTSRPLPTEPDASAQAHPGPVRAAGPNADSCPGAQGSEGTESPSGPVSHQRCRGPGTVALP